MERRAHRSDSKTGSTRVYPTCCTSAYCGKTDCTGCRNWPKLVEFKEWVDRTGACVEDPVWCPSVYAVPKEQCDDQSPETPNV